MNWKGGITFRPEYFIWHDMKRRCTDPRRQEFSRYGGRGIFVCDAWMGSFDQFYADMGPRPSKKHTIERIDNNDGYHPKNCVWATRKSQSLNRRGWNKLKIKHIYPRTNGYRVTFHRNKKTIHVGNFKKINDAICARDAFLANTQEVRH